MNNRETDLPASHIPYTDKYFLRTNEILKKEGINPIISMKIFCRGEGWTAGLKEAVDILDRYSNLQSHQGEVWITQKDQFGNNEPLMVIKGPAQDFIELETMYLGVLSAAISSRMGIEPPDAKKVIDKLKRLKDIYMDIPIIYFGARHYHWSLDKMIAGAALKGGATQTSTDIGSSNIGQKGIGTIPHLLVIILATIYGKEEATLKSAELFDKHIPLEVPRVTLVDTFNREITDALAVARYFGIRRNSFRIDTCGENIAEGGSPYLGKQMKDPEFKTGTGVTIQGVTRLRDALIENGYGENTDIFLSSGFGDEDKAKAFVAADKEYQSATGYRLFSAVGIGEIYPARFCCADIYEADNHPIAKTGREVQDINFSTMKRVI